MNFTDEELQKIQEYAGLFLSYEEIATLLDKNISEFVREIRKSTSQCYYAYLKGKTMSKVEIRKNIVKLAKHGNHNAEQLVNQFIIDQEVREV